MASKKQRDSSFAQIIGNLLIAQGYELTNINSNDAAMQAAIKSFQAQHGLKQTGTATAKTFEALKSPPPVVVAEDAPIPVARPEDVDDLGFAAQGRTNEIDPTAEALPFSDDMDSPGIEPDIAAGGGGDVEAGAPVDDQRVYSEDELDNIFADERFGASTDTNSINPQANQEPYADPPWGERVSGGFAGIEENVEGRRMQASADAAKRTSDLEKSLRSAARFEGWAIKFNERIAKDFRENGPLPDYDPRFPDGYN